jgi:hypothetical protein
MAMKKHIHIVLAITLLLGSLAFVPVRQGASVQPDPAGPDLPNKVYLPLNIGRPQHYTLTGQVKDNANKPVAGAVVVDNFGRSTTTDAGGNYIFSSLNPGIYAVAPSKDGYMFYPSVQSVDFPSAMGPLNFTALTACTDIMVNGGFETDAAWEIPVTEYTAQITDEGYHTPLRSLVTGIPKTWQNKYSWSSGRQLVFIPSDADSATLRMWIYPQSTEAYNAPVPKAPSGPDFGHEVMAYDAQYVAVLNQWDQHVETIMWMRSDNRTWTLHEFNLTKYAGKYIKIEVGTYNDGYGGSTAMYVDDVSLEVCSDGTQPPTPTPVTPVPTAGACYNGFSNSSFESNSAWGVPITEYPAAYSADTANTGTRSMRTGIVNTNANRYSYSDAYQLVSIPSSATSATLNVYFNRRTNDVGYAPVPKLAVGEKWGEAPLAYDLQYILVLNQWGTIIDTLYWDKVNVPSWAFGSFDLTHYRGQTIRIQFGTYNDGYGGITSMYVDDMSVDICSGSTPPTATPPGPTPTVPPGSCTERIYNGNLEAFSNWYIPATRYSAGYSTSQAHSPIQSMRTGIQYTSHDRYSYSDARQTVTIPWNASSATLGFWLLPLSEESLAAKGLPDLPEGKLFGLQALASDVQYVIILDAWGNWIDTLLWRRNNSGVWTYFQYDLTYYRGSTIQINFGVYNDGYNGVTTQYFDDVSMVTCP